MGTTEDTEYTEERNHSVISVNSVVSSF